MTFSKLSLLSQLRPFSLVSMNWTDLFLSYILISSESYICDHGVQSSKHSLVSQSNDKPRRTTSWWFSTLCSAKKKSYTVTIQLGVVVLLFVLALIEWIIDCVNTVGEARITLINDPDGDLSSKYGDALEFIFRRNAIQAMLYAYMVRQLVSFYYLCSHLDRVSLEMPL